MMVACFAALGGCHLGRGGTDLLQATGAGDSERAEALCVKGRRFWQSGRLDRAADAFERATTADPSYGPAHNNLGLVQYETSDLYAAAWSFQRASELMPGRAEPLNNLGLVMQSAGRLEDAISHFAEAYELRPEQPDYLANLVLARRLRGDSDWTVEQQLQELAFKETRPAWRSWVEDELALTLPADRHRSAVATESTEVIATPRPAEAEPKQKSEPPTGPVFLPPPAPPRASSDGRTGGPVHAYVGTLSDQ